MKIPHERLIILVDEAMALYPYPKRGHEVRKILWALIMLLERDWERITAA